MSHSAFKDSRATSLLQRVRDDVSQLREDFGSLLSHTTRTTLPGGAREIADQAKSQFAAGGAYAASRFNELRGHPNRRQAEWVGGAVIVGLLALGAYAFLKSDCCRTQDEEEDEIGSDANEI